MASFTPTVETALGRCTLPALEQTLGEELEFPCTLVRRFEPLQRELFLPVDDPSFCALQNVHWRGDTDIDNICRSLLEAARRNTRRPQLQIDTLYIGVRPDWSEFGGTQEMKWQSEWLANAATKDNIALALYWFSGSTPVVAQQHRHTI